ncbi:MAG: RsmD family RNA methyltransferase [Chitinophagaceae bacterium]
MRIISGKYGGRKILPPAQMPHTRPTTDRAKEGLFNILQNSFPIEGCKTLDLFGGTGAISFELASRGSARQVLIEKDQKQAGFIENAARQIGIPDLKVFQTDVRKYLRQTAEQFDFIFAGPPYKLTWIDEIPDMIFEHHLLKEDGWFVLEHTAEHQFDKHPYFSQKRNYGDTIFSIFIFLPAK